MYRMSLNRVHDTVRVSEGKESLLLHVDDIITRKMPVNIPWKKFTSAH